MEWLGKLPFATKSDYGKAIANVYSVWNIKSPSEAATWLQSSALNPSLKSEFAKAAQP